jgi:dienelactone hydrolase
MSCIQHSLAQLGFDPGPVDGQIGPATRNAHRDYRTSFLGEGEVRELNSATALAECATLALNGVTAHRITVDDGIELEAFLHRPLGNGRAFPAVIILHGWGGSARDVNYTARLFTASGFAALTVSMRGWGQSDGVDDCGLKQSDDTVAVLEWLAKYPEIDGEQIGMLGYSQGGQVALLAAAKSDRHRYVVSFFAPIELESWAAQTTNSGIPEYVRSVCSPDMAARSPIGVASDISASVLLVHGTRDSRVPITQSLQMVDALKAANAPVDIMLVPGQPHLFSNNAWEDVFPEVLEFARENSINDQIVASDVAHNSSAQQVQNISTFLDIPALSIPIDGPSTISLISPSCSSCVSHFLNALENPASFNSENEHVFLFFAQNDADIDIVSTIMCDRSKSAIIAVEYFEEIRNQSHFLAAETEANFTSNLLRLVHRVALSNYVSEAELQVCQNGTDIATEVAAITSMIPWGLASQEGTAATLHSTAAQEISLPWHTGGAGVGPSRMRRFLNEISTITSRIQQLLRRVQSIATTRDRIISTATNPASPRVGPSLDVRTAPPEPTTQSNLEAAVLYNSLLSADTLTRQAESQDLANRFILSASRSETYSNFLAPPKYDSILQSAGLPVSLAKECVALTRAVSGLGATSTWEPGSQLNDDLSGNYPNIQPGTPIATFENGRYPSSGKNDAGEYVHAAIFLGYIPDNQGNIVGISVLDQYTAGGDKPPGVTAYTFGDTRNFLSNASNYSVIQ